ncbi:MAG: hypothetical protein K2G55_09675 [Lachnospiraceae bacterium]|nr:hypothetical protein [Lachnospiraceae bacterium]MDE7202831.1 hypothetical protein [Lachnospiraceae bacterium]
MGIKTYSRFSVERMSKNRHKPARKLATSHCTKVMPQGYPNKRCVNATDNVCRQGNSMTHPEECTVTACRTYS